MTAALRWLGAAGALVLLQVAVLPTLGAARWAPDLFLVATVLIAFRRGRMTGQVAGCALGLLQGLFATVPFGAQALLLTLTGFAAGSARRMFYRNHPLAPVLFTIPALLLLPAGLAGIGWFAGQEVPLLPGWAPAPATIVAALAAGLLPWPPTNDRR